MISPKAGSFSEETSVPTRFSVKSPGRGWTYEQTRWLWKQAEELGFYSVLHNDHMYGSTLEGWTALAAMFSQTESIRGGTMVTSNSFRHPSILAKMIATVDIISNGRLSVGLGTGNEAEEYQTYGLKFPSPSDRVEQLAETCEILTRSWSGFPVTFTGKHFQLDDAMFSPLPLQKPHPPLVLGVKGDRALKVAVAYADEWNWNRSDAKTEGFFGRFDKLDELCAAAGRDPRSLRKSLGFRRLYSDIMAGRETLDDTVAVIQRAIERGAGHIVFMLDDGASGPEEVDFYAETLIPLVT
jgi:alkanesulfonate monooxygenase SsuD/methylene tetrahydromethanopterin reductase-like flavin-dependent oxidoreductase (luciferase family)